MNPILLLDADGRQVGTNPVDPTAPAVCEIVRSVSFKLNLGNYQSMDFFCSQKAQCRPEDAEEVSLGLYEFCYEEVMKSANEIRRKQAAKKGEAA